MFHVPAHKQAAPITDAELGIEIARNNGEFKHRINTPRSETNTDADIELNLIKWFCLNNLRTVRNISLVAA